LSIWQRIILILGLLLIIMISIVNAPTKQVCIENPARVTDYSHYFNYPAYIMQDVADNTKIIRYDVVIMFSTAVLFFVVKPNKRSEKE